MAPLKQQCGARLEHPQSPTLHDLPGRREPHPHGTRRPHPVDPAADDPQPAVPRDHAKDGIAARHNQVGWNKQYLSKVLSNWNAIALAD